MRKDEEIIKLKNGLEISRGEAERILETIGKLNPDFTLQKKRLAVDTLLFLAGPFLAAYYIVKRESIILLYVGIFSAISGLHGLQRYLEFSREIRELKSKVGEDKLKILVDEIRESVK